MLLATYQPDEPLPEHRNGQYDCFRPKLGGEYPAFCFPLRAADEFRFRSLLAAPLKPERLVLIETEKFARFDAVEWNNILCLPRESAEFAECFEHMFENVDERFSEYVVASSELECPFAEVSLRELIEDEAFLEVEDEPVRNMLLAQQRAAKTMIARSLRGAGGARAERGPSGDFRAMVTLNSFLSFLGGATYHMLISEPSTFIEMIPFLPDSTSATALAAWDAFSELRYRVFDTAEGGSHQDYLDMAAALERAVGEQRQRALSARVGRNDLCPCMSGKKFKSCHGKKPIDVFPFE